MRSTRPQIARMLSVALLAGCVSAPALAQRGSAQGRPKAPPAAPNPNANRNAGKQAENHPGKQPGKNKEQNEARAMMGLPNQWVEQIQSMSPQEQERFMQNNERFKNLPPERQEQIRRRLQRWNSLTPEQQQKMRIDAETLKRLTPEQRRFISEDLMPRWQQLPRDRQQAIRRHLVALRGLSEADRNARLNDPNFMRELKPDEQKLLRDLNTLRVGPAAEGPGDNPLL